MQITTAPLKENDVANNMVKGTKDLAEVLLVMPFGVLMQVAHEMVSMVAEAEPRREIDTPTGMAEMLYDWAESNTDQ